MCCALFPLRMESNSVTVSASVVTIKLGLQENMNTTLSTHTSICLPVILPSLVIEPQLALKIKAIN